MLVLNAFSIKMVADRPTEEISLVTLTEETDDEALGDKTSFMVDFRRVSEPVAAALLAQVGFDSAVGHEGTAKVLSQRLGLDIPVARVNVALTRGEPALLAQVDLPRLAEGEVLTAEQVAKAPIEYYVLEVI